MKMNFSIPVLALVLGAALGYCLHPSDAPKPATAPKAAAAKKPIAEVPDAEVRALRLRIRNLEGQLAARPAATAAPTPATASEAPERRGRLPFVKMLENLKKTDPRHYAAMTNHFATMRRNRQARARAKADFLSSLDTSTLSAADREGVEKLQNLIARQDELSEREHAEGMTDEERRSIFEERRALDRELREANRTVRQTLLKETARSTGLDDEATAALTETIGEIIEATEGGGGHPPPGPPPGEMPAGGGAR